MFVHLKKMLVLFLYRFFFLMCCPALLLSFPPLQTYFMVVLCKARWMYILRLNNWKVTSHLLSGGGVVWIRDVIHPLCWKQGRCGWIIYYYSEGYRGDIVEYVRMTQGIMDEGQNEWRDEIQNKTKKKSATLAPPCWCLEVRGGMPAKGASSLRKLQGGGGVNMAETG